MFKVALVHIDNPNPKLPDWVGKRLETHGVSFVYRQCEFDTDVIEVAADADVVWVNGGGRVVTPATLPDLKRCRAIIRTGSGTDTDNIPGRGSLRAWHTRGEYSTGNRRPGVRPRHRPNAVSLPLDSTTGPGDA